MSARRVTVGKASRGRILVVGDRRSIPAPYARWLDQAGDIPLSLSVNISARQLQEKCLVEDVTRALQNSQIEPERLVLEITESVFMEDVDTVLERVQQLKALGVRLALDDFGTGYSSLGYLNRFPIDIIKIDKTFVDQISGAVEDVALIKAIIQLSKSFGLSTVAEGIEEAGQAERLATLGCLLGQGFLWSRPVPPARSQMFSSGSSRPPSGSPPSPREWAGAVS